MASSASTPPSTTRSSRLAEIFFAASPHGMRPTDKERLALQQRLEQAVESAHVAWPGVALAPEAFVAHVAAVLTRPENDGQTVDALHTDDLFLACACAGGDTRAIALCDAEFGAEIGRSLARQNVPADLADDLRQELREWLFVRGPSGDPGIITYSGRGRLGGWLRVIVVRRALKLFRAQHRLRPLGKDQLARLVEEFSSSGTPELELMQVLYQTDLRHAFGRALDSLTPDDRDVLRRHFVDQQSIDQVGAARAVHRSTAARHIERAKRNLILSIRRELMEHKGLAESTMDSVLRLVQSKLALSVSLFLGDGDTPAERR